MSTWPLVTNLTRVYTTAPFSSSLLPLFPLYPKKISTTTLNSSLSFLPSQKQEKKYVIRHKWNMPLII